MSFSTAICWFVGFHVLPCWSIAICIPFGTVFVFICWFHGFLASLRANRRLHLPFVTALTVICWFLCFPALVDRPRSTIASLFLGIHVFSRGPGHLTPRWLLFVGSLVLMRAHVYAVPSTLPMRHRLDGLSVCSLILLRSAVGPLSCTIAI